MELNLGCLTVSLNDIILKLKMKKVDGKHIKKEKE